MCSSVVVTHSSFLILVEIFFRFSTIILSFTSSTECLYPGPVDERAADPGAEPGGGGPHQVTSR